MLFYISLSIIFVQIRRGGGIAAKIWYTGENQGDNTWYINEGIYYMLFKGEIGENRERQRKGEVEKRRKRDRDRNLLVIVH